MSIFRKFIFYIMAIILLPCFALNAEELTSDDTKKQFEKTDSTSRSGASQRGYFEIYGSRGLTYPMGDIAGDGGQVAHIADSEGVGINTGYMVGDGHIIYLGITSLTQRFEVERNYMNKLMLTAVEAKFLNFDISYRYQQKWYYSGAGLFIGVPFGTWSRKNALDGDVTESLLYGDLESAACNQIGLTAFGGLTYRLNDEFSMNAGLRMLFPFTPAYKANQDSIKIFDLSICLSVSHMFQMPFID